MGSCRICPAGSEPRLPRECRAHQLCARPFLPQADLRHDPGPGVRTVVPAELLSGRTQVRFLVRGAQTHFAGDAYKTEEGKAVPRGELGAGALCRKCSVRAGACVRVHAYARACACVRVRAYVRAHAQAGRRAVSSPARAS